MNEPQKSINKLLEMLVEAASTFGRLNVLRDTSAETLQYWDRRIDELQTTLLGLYALRPKQPRFEDLIAKATPQVVTCVVPDKSEPEYRYIRIFNAGAIQQYIEQGEHVEYQMLSDPDNHWAKTTTASLPEITALLIVGVYRLRVSKNTETKGRYPPQPCT